MNRDMQDCKGGDASLPLAVPPLYMAWDRPAWGQT